ncbi:chloride channel protein [Caldiplasma sukawensis]
MERTLKRILKNSSGKWLFIGTLIGVIAGFGSIIFYIMINVVTKYMLYGISGFNPPSSGLTAGLSTYKISSDVHRLFFPIILGLGGLFVGIFLTKTAPEAKGHGTDAAIDAFHNKGGYIRRRIPIVKTIASAVTIGSGGSAGREGPTAQIAAGFGSFVADVLKLDEKDRRIAVAAGIGAGIGSIFLAPLGGAILSTEILYKRDFEVEALIPSVVASIVGYSIFGYYTGYRTLFELPSNQVIGFFHPISLLVYLFIGIVCGIAGLFYIKAFYGVSNFFHNNKYISPYVRPAIGGIIVGVIAIFFPEVLGLGYGWVQQIIDGNLSLFASNYSMLFLIFIVLFFLKVIATSFTIGSEGSGGVFAPGMVSGAFIGAALAVPIKMVFGFLSFDEIVIVSMIALFGGASKAPLSIIIMGTEMTGSYALFIPIMLATTVSYFITGQNTIYRSQVLDRSESPAHEDKYKKPILDNIPVYTAMKKDYIRVSKYEKVRFAINKLRESRTKGAVVEDEGKLEGFLSIENIPENLDYDQTVEQVMSLNVPSIEKNQSLHDALNILIKEPSGKLVVIDKNFPGKVLGTLTISEIAEAYNLEIRRLKIENKRKMSKENE